MRRMPLRSHSSPNSSSKLPTITRRKCRSEPANSAGPSARHRSTTPTTAASAPSSVAKAACHPHRQHDRQRLEHLDRDRGRCRGHRQDDGHRFALDSSSQTSSSRLWLALTPRRAWPCRGLSPACGRDSGRVAREGLGPPLERRLRLAGVLGPAHIPCSDPLMPALELSSSASSSSSSASVNFSLANSLSISATNFRTLRPARRTRRRGPRPTPMLAAPRRPPRAARLAPRARCLPPRRPRPAPARAHSGTPRCRGTQRPTAAAAALRFFAPRARPPPARSSVP